MIHRDELQELMPHAGERVDLFLDPLNAAMLEFEINTPMREAAFLAQIAEESEELLYVRELASGRAYDDRADLGNTRPEAVSTAAAHNATPGPWWKGRGLIETTGYTNYLACGTALDLDLLNAPELLEQPVNACRSAGWFWKQHGLNELADKGDFLLITKRINGGTRGYGRRLSYYEHAKTLLEVS